MSRMFWVALACGLFVWLVHVWSETHKAPSATVSQLAAVRVVTADDRTQPKIVRDPVKKSSVWDGVLPDRPVSAIAPAADRVLSVVEVYTQADFARLIAAVLKIRRASGAADLSIDDFVDAAEFRGIVAALLAAGPVAGTVDFSRCAGRLSLSEITTRSALALDQGFRAGAQSLGPIVDTRAALAFVCFKALQS